MISQFFKSCKNGVKCDKNTYCFQKGDMSLLLPTLSSAKEMGLKLTLHVAEVCACFFVQL